MDNHELKHELKYVVNKNNDFVIFSNTLTHRDIARAMGGMPAGAGMCQFRDGVVRCYGESLTLDIKSRREKDEAIINKKITYVQTD